VQPRAAPEPDDGGPREGVPVPLRERAERALGVVERAAARVEDGELGADVRVPAVVGTALDERRVHLAARAEGPGRDAALEERRVHLRTHRGGGGLALGAGDQRERVAEAAVVGLLREGGERGVQGGVGPRRVVRFGRVGTDHGGGKGEWERQRRHGAEAASASRRGGRGGAEDKER